MDNEQKVDMKYLCEVITEKIGYDKCFYDLEPVFCQRDDHVTEDILVNIFMNLRFPLQEIIQKVKKKSPDSNTATIVELIKSVAYGTVQIYPSELKRAGIPLPVYRYITFLSSQKKYTVDAIVIFWKSRFLFNEKIEYPTVLLFDDILSLFLLHFNVYEKNKKLRIKHLLQIKIPEYFYYLDCTLKNMHNRFLDKVKILETCLNSDVADQIAKQSYANECITSAYKIAYESIEKMTKEITVFWNEEEQKFNLIEFVLKTVRKYFEYRLVKFKEKKLFGLFDYTEVL